MTRMQLAETLKKRMARKPLSKITASELAGDCHINRKTFCYHFQDIYALSKWMPEQATIEVIGQFAMLIDSMARQQEVTLAEPFRAFLCDFFTEALASVLLSWVQPSAITRDKEWVLNCMEHLLQTALPAAIQSAKDNGAGYVAG